MRKLVVLGFVVVLASMAVPAEARHHPASLEALSTQADKVTGGDVLVKARAPRGARVLLNGDDVTSAFDDGVGVVDGLRVGRNWLSIVARKGRRWRTLETLKLRNHPITGPVFSGPHQTPFICRTAETELGPPTDDDCSAPTQVAWLYRSTAGTFKPLADPADRPADLAQTTTRDGRTVDYVVRMETGTINRAIYRTAVLADAWNRRLVYNFGGGCGTGYHQGTLAQSAVLDHAALSQGFAVATASLNTFQTACNDVLSAETAMMVKERLAEDLGRPPVWTMGWGGSGGAIQQIMIASNYPGLLDGIVPSATFQDSQLGEPVDCRLLNRYFATAGASLTAAQRQAINGYRNIASCVAWDVAFANVIVADIGCDPSVPASLIYNATTNPTGARCTLWDSMVNIWGRDPATGWARRTLDNVGVQYGLKALQDGAITVDQFLDLNEKIGGYDNDGKPRPERAVADPKALEIAYRTGRVTSGGGGLPYVPILDVRSYTDFPGVDIHTYIHSYVVRERLRRATGSAANHVMWRAAPAGASSGPMSAAARETMAAWLDAIEDDDSRRSKRSKIVRNKPTEAVDACWDATGTRIDDPAEIGATGPCTQLYPPASTPRLRAGARLDSMAIKCRLRKIDPADYPALTADQLAKLKAIFPTGVCDWSRPGVGQQRLKGTWLEFGS
jgi:uncharacterized tannase-like protein DUF6351